MFKAKYEVSQASVHELPTEVELNGIKIKALVPSLVVQLVPLENAGESGPIKIVIPNVEAQAPFVVGDTLTVTFEEG